MVCRFAHVRLVSLPSPSARRSSLLTFALLFHQPARSCSCCVRAHRPCIATPSGVCERCVRLQKRGRLTYQCNLPQVVANLSVVVCFARPSAPPARPGLAPLFVSVVPPHDGGPPKCSSSRLPQVPPSCFPPLGSDAHDRGGTNGTSHSLESIESRTRSPFHLLKDPLRLVPMMNAYLATLPVVTMTPQKASKKAVYLDD